MKSLHLAVITLLLLAFGFIMIQVGKQQQLADMRHAYSICMTSHAQLNGKLEDACGQAQDATHTEFICANYTPDANCWLEVK